ncbi:MAG: ABC transporter ATP-binding protein [Bacillota bacterium]|nr:ABC transporter ATP-binding protein [Bacillota bacterium]
MLKLVNVSKYYSSNNVIALGLRKVNLELRMNEFVAIVGESGSGKTTLLNVICGIDTYEEGEMYVNGEETSYYTIADMENFRKKYVAFVFQNYNLIDSYTVLQNVEAPLILAGYPKKEIRSRAMDIIRRVGLEKHIHHKSTKLSGGQKQRVVIARALAKNAPIIAADEPTGNLDSESAKQIIELLHEIAKDKLVIIVTHDYEQVKDYATRKIRIFDGEIVEDVEVAPKEKRDLPKIADSDSRLKFWDHLQIAFRNLLAVPRKSIFMVIIFTVFSLFIAFAYGGYVYSLQSVSNTGNYYFINTGETRIVVRKADKSMITQDDLDELLSIQAVEGYAPYDYALDDYVYLYETVMNEYDYYDSIYASPTLVSFIDDAVLAAGRLPEADNEIVLGVSSYYLDEFLTEHYDTDLVMTNNGYYGDQAPIGTLLHVVGIVLSDSLYFTSENIYTSVFMTDSTYESAARRIYLPSIVESIGFSGIDNLGNSFSTTFERYYMQFIADDTVLDNTIVYPVIKDSCNAASEVCSVDGALTITDMYSTRSLVGMTYQILPTSDYRDTNSIRVSPATYEALFDETIYQVSIFAKSPSGVAALALRVGTIFDNGLSLKYRVIYPFGEQNPDEFTGQFLPVILLSTTISFLFTLIAVTLITYLIFRAIINTKMHDYAIFRTIGASQASIKRFIYLENMITAAVAYAIVASALIAMTGRVGFLNDILYAYTFGTYVTLFIIILFMAYFISSKYCRKVFGESVHRALKQE